MRPVARRVTSIVLVLAGLAVMGFFGLLLAIADCGPDCQRAGERAPVVALVGFGLFLVVAGVTLGRGTYRAVGYGLLAAGALSLVGIAWLMATQGARGSMVWIPLAVAAGDALIGAWLAFRRWR